MIINHNINAITSSNRANKAEKTKANAMQKLSSGLRINQVHLMMPQVLLFRKMKAQIRGMLIKHRPIFKMGFL